MAKVTLRPIELRDAETVYRFRLDEEVMFWAAGGFGNAIPSYAALEEDITKQSSLDAARTFVIEVQEPDGSVVIGTISFRDLDRVARHATVGMLIGNKSYWGRGYGTQAVREFVKMLFTRYNLHRINLDTFADNKRAIRCYEKCGFVVEGVRRQSFWTMNGYCDQVLMGLLRDEWQEANKTYYLVDEIEMRR